MTLPAETVAVVAVAAGVGVLVLLVLVALLLVRLSRLRRAYGSALDPSRREDLFQAVRRQGDDLAALREDLGVVHGNTEHLRELLAGAVSRVGVIRYDAFPDMGGALSFSAALLDEHGDGVVISAINGRSETRCYAKPLAGGASEHNLSDEELRAIQAAVDDAPSAAGTSRRRKRAS